MSRPIDYNDPDVQEFILTNQIGSIAEEIAKRLDIAPSEAFVRFYSSATCARLHDKRTGLYLMSDLYVVDDYLQSLSN